MTDKRLGIRQVESGRWMTPTGWERHPDHAITFDSVAQAEEALEGCQIETELTVAPLEGYSRADHDKAVVYMAQALEDHPGIAFELGAGEAMALVGFLHLGLRHGPASELATAPIVKGIVDGIVEGLARGDGRLELYLRRGENPAFDFDPNEQ